MGFHPGDPGELVLLRENATPKISMLDAGYRSPLEGAVECVSDIPTVGKEMESALGALQSLKNCSDFPSLSRLVRAGDCTAIFVPIEKDETPSSARHSRGAATAPISRYQGNHVREKGLGLPLKVLLHLKAPGGRVVIRGGVARVP